MSYEVVRKSFKRGLIGTYLILVEIIWKVSNHDLVLGWNSISWWTTLATLTGWASALWLSLVGLSSGLVGSFGQRENLSGSRCLGSALLRTGL